MRLRIDAKLRPWLRKGLEITAKELETTITEILNEVIEYGLNWKQKKIKKTLNENFTWLPNKKETTHNDAVSHYQKQDTPEDDEIPPEEMEEILAKLRK